MISNNTVGTITYEPESDNMTCSCGNIASTDGFVPCDKNGIECEPDEHWEDDRYVCQSCGATIALS